jgi:carboxymethylenebutenolidase
VTRKQVAWEVALNTTQQYMIAEELDHYRNGWISRRDFLRRAVLLGAGAATATAMAASVKPARRAGAASVMQVSPFHVPEDDPRVVASWTSFISTDGASIEAYLARPADAPMAGLPAVAVCHENQGANYHIRDVARRFASQGYVAIAPDLISRAGIRTDLVSQEDAQAALSRLDADQNPRDLLAAVESLKAQPGVDASKLAATGYCFGGGVTWRLATISPDLRAVAPFYGSNPPLAEVPNIRAAVLAVYGDLDDRINAGIGEIEAAMTAAGVNHRVSIYPNSQHAFHADHRPAYNPETAPQAWIETLTWFAQYLELPAPSW